MTVRRARPSDVESIYRLMVDLARYERAEHEVRSSASDVSAALFDDEPSAHCHVVDVEGEIVGFALWFTNFSTWTGTRGLYIEDLFVEPAHRGRGWGLALMSALARECVERGWSRFEWSVLDWNRPAISFYRRIGAEAMEEWTRYRLSGDALRALGDGADPAIS